MTVHTRAGMRPNPRLHRLAALALAGTLALAGCSDDEEPGEDAAPTGADGAVGTGDGGGQTAEAPTGPPAEPADIQPIPGVRSASGDGGNIRIEAEHAGFVLPSGNIACSVTPSSAVCQIDDKSYTPQAGHLSDSNVGPCSAGDADAMTLASGRGSWTCVPEALTGQAAVTSGGWWAEETGGPTVDLGGATLAVLPYGSSLSIGTVTCSSAEAGVECANPDIGERFFLARTSYNYD